MVFYRLNLKWLAATLFAAGALVVSARAQGAGDTIIFSKPADDGIESPVTSSYPSANSAVETHEFAPSFFNSGSSSPLPLPPVNPNWNRAANNRGSWALMTPEQIMGVQTPEQIFGLPGKNEDKNLSPAQQFLQRQENLKLTAATNGMSGASSPWRNDSNPFNQRDNAKGPFSQSGLRPDSDPSDSTKDFSKFFNVPQSSPFDQNQKMNFKGTGAFAMPSSGATKMDLEQEAEMQRFRALIGENPSPDNSLSSFAKTSATKLPSPNQSSLQFDMFGHPLAKSVSEPNQPTSLTALSELEGSYTPPAKPKKAWWQPQPAPWLSSGLPQPNSLSAAPPLRKFY